MSNWRNTWKVYSIGLLVAWVIVLVSVWILDGSSVRKAVLLVFYGYFVGWLSATIKIVLMTKKSTDKS